VRASAREVARTGRRRQPLTTAPLRLADERFEVFVTWRTSQGTSGSGQPERLTGDSGTFWFFDPDNVEVVIKVLDACGPFDRFWVFAAGLTDVEVEITVLDTDTDTARVYRNPLGVPFQPLQDTGAFATCP
jgi:AMMECR1 domain-containing protein